MLVYLETAHADSNDRTMDDSNLSPIKRSVSNGDDEMYSEGDYEGTRGVELFLLAGLVPCERDAVIVKIIF